jgi:hypothetical protein
MGAMFMKPSGKVELLIITQMPPFRTSWLYLVPPFTLPLGYAASLVEERYELFLKVPNIFKEKCFYSLFPKNEMCLGGALNEEM